MHWCVPKDAHLVLVPYFAGFFMHKDARGLCSKICWASNGFWCDIYDRLVISSSMNRIRKLPAMFAILSTQYQPNLGQIPWGSGAQPWLEVFTSCLLCAAPSCYRAKQAPARVGSASGHRSEGSGFPPPRTNSSLRLLKTEITSCTIGNWVHWFDGELLTLCWRFTIPSCPIDWLREWVLGGCKVLVQDGMLSDEEVQAAMRLQAILKLCWRDQPAAWIQN